MNRIAALSLCLSALFSLTACGLLADEVEEHGDITINETIPFDFDINADELCDAASGSLECDGKPAKSPMAVPLGSVEKDLDIDVVEATGEPRLREVSSRFEEITITGVEWKVTNNTLTFDTPRIDLYMGPMPVDKHDDDDAFKLTTLPSVPKMTDRSGTEDVTGSAQSKASDVLRNLKMSAIPYGEPSVDKGEQFPPKGKATVEMKINVKFVANPVGAVRQ